MDLLRGLIAIVLLLGVPSIAAADDLEKLLENALAEERVGRLTQAHRILRQNEGLLATRAKAAQHASNLAMLLNALEGADVHQEHGRLDQARAVIEKVLPTLDPIDDKYLLQKAYGRLALIGLAEGRLTRRQTSQALQTANRLASNGEYDEALALYSRIAGDSSVPQDLQQEARTGRRKVSTAMSPSFWLKSRDSFVDGFRTILVWCTYFGLAALVIAGGTATRRFWLRPREGIGLAIEDWTAEPDRREASSQSLTQEIWRQTSPLARRTDGAANLDAFEDLDGAGLGSFRIEVPPLEKLTTLLPEGSPVQVGPFSLSPRQILAAFRSLFYRPSQTLFKGSLLIQDGETVLSMKRIENGTPGNSAQIQAWEMREKGDGARTRAVQRTATRIAFELASWRVTSNWQSFILMRDGFELLRDEQRSAHREETLASAAEFLQLSLRQDPSNWLARFSFATVQRKLGQNEIAAEHFELLEALMDRAPETGGASDVLQRYPELKYILRYNRWIALSKVRDEIEVERAIRGLKELISDKIPPQHRAKLRLLARSALASALLAGMELLRERMRMEGKPSNATAAQSRSMQKIRDIAHAVEAQDRTLVDWREYSLACAAVHNSLGRASYLLGNHQRAIDAFRKAITLEPELVDAHVNLAQVYVRKGDPDSLRKAKDRLHLAIRFSPSNQKAHYLLGRIYTHEIYGEYSKAKSHLERADLFSGSFVLLAEIYAENEQDFHRAVDYLRRSLFIDPTVNYRYEMFVEYVLRLDERKAASNELLREAEKRAEQLHRNGRKRSLRERASNQRERVRQALHRRSRGTEMPAHVPPEVEAAG